MFSNGDIIDNSDNFCQKEVRMKEFITLILSLGLVIFIIYGLHSIMKASIKSIHIERSCAIKCLESSFSEYRYIAGRCFCENPNKVKEY